MTKLRRSKIKYFNIGTEKGLKEAERHQTSLLRKYDDINVRLVGVDKVIIYGEQND